MSKKHRLSAGRGKLRPPSETWLLRTLHDLRRADALRSLDGSESQVNAAARDRSPRLDEPSSPLSDPAFPAEPVEAGSDAYPRSGP